MWLTVPDAFALACVREASLRAMQPRAGAQQHPVHKPVAVHDKYVHYVVRGVVQAVLADVDEQRVVVVAAAAVVSL